MRVTAKDLNDRAELVNGSLKRRGTGNKVEVNASNGYYQLYLMRKSEDGRWRLFQTLESGSAKELYIYMGGMMASFSLTRRKGRV